MRASLPRPSTSCSGTMAVSATEARAARMSVQWISAAVGAEVPQREVAARAPPPSPAAGRVAGAGRSTSRPSCRCRGCRCRPRGSRGKLCGRNVGGLGVAAEGELQDAHAREAEALAQRLHLGRDHAEVLGDDRQRRRARRSTASKSAAPGPFTQRAVHRGRRRRPGTSQYASKPRKWSRRTMSNSSKACAEALDPPGVAVARASRPSRRCGLPQSWPVALK